jgi:hypothetical protein
VAAKGNGPPQKGSSGTLETSDLDNLQPKEMVMGKGLLLWLVGVPIPVIIILWLILGR